MNRMNWAEPTAMRWLIGLLATLLAASPAAAEKVTLTGHFPARFPEASQLRRLAVIPFDGAGGSKVTAAVQAELTTGDETGPPWFTLVSGAAPRRGSRRIGSEGTLSGSVQGGIADTPFEQRTFQCTQYSGKKCVSYATVSCVSRVVNMSVEARITRTSDGRVVYSAAKPLNEQISWCAGQPAPTTDESVLRLALAAARDIKRDISPYSEQYVLKIKESTDGMSKPVKARFKTAVKLSVKDLQGSCRSWAELEAEAPTSAALLHDLGVCAEARGDFRAAGTYYDRSQALVPDGSKETAAATNRIRLLTQWRDQLAQQQSRRQSSEAGEVRALAEADRAAKREAAAAARREAAGRTAARNKAAAAAAAANAQRAAQRQQVAAKYGAGAADAIMAGRVSKGMTAAQVQAAIGAPRRRERIGPGEEQWFYPGRRVVFAGGRVSYVGN